MSILPLLAASPPPADNIGELAGFIAIALGIASIALFVTLRVYDPATVIGPKRLPDRSGVALIAIVLFIGFCIWMFAQQAYIQFRMLQWTKEGIEDPARHIEALLKSDDWAFLSTVPPMITFATMLIAIAFISTSLLDTLGISLRKMGRGILQGILGFIVIGPAVFWTIALMGFAYKRFEVKHPTEHVLLKSLGQSEDRRAAWLICLGAAVCAPLFEELFFRSFIQTLLRQAMLKLSAKSRSLLPSAPIAASPLGQIPSGPPPLPILQYNTPLTLAPQLEADAPLQPAAWQGWTAILLTSLIFATFHAMWMWPAIFVLAIGLGYVYERTGNLWATITIHCLFNSMETLQYLFIMHGRGAH